MNTDTQPTAAALILDLILAAEGTLDPQAAALNVAHAIADGATYTFDEARYISRALESLETGYDPGQASPEVVGACRAALAYGDLSGLQGCGFTVTR